MLEDPRVQSVSRSAPQATETGSARFGIRHLMLWMTCAAFCFWLLRMTWGPDGPTQTSHPLYMGLVVALAIVESGAWMGGLAVVAGRLRRKRDSWYTGHWLLVVMSVTSVLDISTAYLLAGFPVEWRVAGILGLAAIGALVSIAPVTTGSPIGAWRTLFYVLALVNLAPFVYLAGTRVPVLMGWMFMFRWLQLIVPLALCIALALGDRRAPAGSWPHRFGVWMFTVRQVMQVVVYVRWGWY